MDLEPDDVRSARKLILVFSILLLVTMTCLLVTWAWVARG